ncbi:protein GVQW3-like [Sitodiplosis mosellana]|uniref:protein GVQW3-like n=1 Tax=Sitodiplosis mosellana TaxID=263140 RepID=UPI002444EC06|nr:protein GVQW3-like [Sitodiplosis mosellana]
MFREGRESVEDEPHQRRPKTSTDENHVKKIKDLVLENRRSTIRDIADTVDISFGSVQTILKDILHLRRVKSRLVPKTLNLLEKERRVHVCETLLSDYQNVLKCIITGDETWIVRDTVSPLRAIGSVDSPNIRSCPADDRQENCSDADRVHHVVPAPAALNTT